MARKQDAHPFAGRKGSRIRDNFALSLYAKQAGRCKMCGVLVDPTLRGHGDKRSAVVDHIKPWRLMPSLKYEAHNLALVCRQCHATCDSIEKRLSPDADAIAAAKQNIRPVGVDGYRIG